MSIISKNKLANILVLRRKSLNLTQDELGEKTGINRAMIGRIEREDYMPSVQQLEKLFDVLKFNIDDILEKNNYAIYTAFRGKNLTDEEQEGVNQLFNMMSVAKKQIMLRKAVYHEK